ncbi:sugar ABC transporter ATP-binding protein [Conexibacter stalactiti]|uniref:Sugar ABC transporter ATP-binding protein n=1 Tax=Conexibacter stalactiti TaxID=1940611 RepID=A0ABU4HJJ8_9ACTN|nr:sugar ABC transporter ATP-binding protein [Conexibacter stalactiti]MDW5593442.1 sugar ABC transporter ATP-binding protein [Conexibacter stalactiti]MEC5034083.1 sugar ABC transporter ATP-binding protein [Conexibacter stalactiti]
MTSSPDTTGTQAGSASSVEEGAPAVPLVEVRSASKAYGPTVALREVSLSVGAGEIHGLCGQNGAGKSTLVKVLAGLVQLDSGTVLLDGRPIELSRPLDAQHHGIALVDQELSVVPALTVEENILLGGAGRPFVRRRAADRARARELLERVGLSQLSPDARVESLSMAQRQLVEIARLLGREARLLILDEPTASLSRADSLVVFAALRELAARGHSVLYVSHRLDEVLDLCDRVTVVRDGARVADESATALEPARLIELIMGDLHRHERAANAARSAPDASDAVELVVRVAQPPRIGGVALRIRAGSIVGLAGQVGSGTSELLRALAGLEPGGTASIELPGGRVARPTSSRAAQAAGIDFVSNDRKGEGLFLERSVGENLVATRLDRISRAGIVGRRALREVAGRLSERVHVKTRGLDAGVLELSGGNQQKVFIGRCLERGSDRILLLDEPTRGVDVHGRAEIHDLVREAAGNGTTVIFASGEPDEVLDLADVVVCLHGGDVVAVRRAEEMTASDLLAETTRGRAAATEEPDGR